MKIVIAGAGAVGTHLATLLSKENQNIILVDEDSNKTETLSNSGDYDLLTLNVSPTSINGLKEAGVPGADLFIAVTPEETRNITCCMLAHALGAKKTVARVDNSEYMTPEHLETFQKIGIDSLIYPEMLAAEEIVDSFKYSWLRQYWEVHGGALLMLGAKMRETAKVLNIPLKDLCRPGASPYHVVVIKRGENTIIPGGNDVLQLNDVAYFMTTKEHIETIRDLAGKEDYADVHNVMIMGGSKTAYHVGRRKPSNVTLKIIETNDNTSRKLIELLDTDGIRIIRGDARDTRLLVDEGIRDTQAFAALTSDTEANILACMAARRLGVHKTIAMVENMDYVSMAENLDIGTIINKKMIAASHIYKMMMRTDVASLKCLTIANADVSEFIVSEGSEVTKCAIRDLKLPQGVTLGGMVRDGVGAPIFGNTVLQPGDSVVVLCLSGKIKQMDRYFCKPTSLIKRAMSVLNS